ncbi:MAG: hypothetical protein QNJ54_02870 [Prochloraceae cyanobacterium]|nr:hypothetical protein [Prochloraceae cyanobacterium]
MGALVWNFHPYGAKPRSQNSAQISRLWIDGDFCYHNNWLQLSTEILSKQQTANSKQPTANSK